MSNMRKKGFDSRAPSLGQRSLLYDKIRTRTTPKCPSGGAHGVFGVEASRAGLQPVAGTARTSRQFSTLARGVEGTSARHTEKTSFRRPWIATTARSTALTSVPLILVASILGEEPGLGNAGRAACTGLWGSGKDDKKDDDDPFERLSKALESLAALLKDEKKEPDNPFERSKNAIFDILGIVRQKEVEREANVPAELTFSFVMGGCSGFAVKKAGKAVVVGVGLLFVSVQVLNHLGFIKLDYAKLEQYFTEMFDLNRDGKVDGNDLRLMFDRAVDAGAFGLPAYSGFAAGAILGFRYG